MHANLTASHAIAALLERHGWDVTCASDGEQALNAIDSLVPDALVTDLHAPRIDGLALLAHARDRQPELCAVVIAHGARAEAAVDAIRHGALDVQSLPVQLDRLLAVLTRGREHQALVSRVADMEDALARRYGADVLGGRSRAMQRLAEQIRLLASTRASVAILGEPGTGKGEVARALHHGSQRHHGPFIALDASSLDGEAVIAELFGVDEALGGRAGRVGRVERAAGGTLFVEEFVALSSAAQLRLLRFLQTREFERVGGGPARRADVRVVVSSSRPLDADVVEGRLLESLARVLIARIEVPPLRERREDVPVLAEAFVREFNREHGRRVRGITPGALDRLAAHDWPGNVRELRNVIEGMIVAAEGRRPVDVSALPAALRNEPAQAPRLAFAVGMTLEEVERQLVDATLRHVGWSKPRAAAMLGMGLRTLYRRIAALGLRPPR